jgi:hypothetical protein
MGKLGSQVHKKGGDSMSGNKNSGSRYIVAVKNYDNTILKLKEGTISLSSDKSIYLKMFESQSIKADNLKELKKFVRANKKSPKDVNHYWESLIIDGFTLVNVEYLEKMPSIEHVCNNDVVKFVCKV